MKRSLSRLNRMLELVKINVSELAPPEPMTKILQALAKLSPDQCLQVQHNRQPFPLYDKLTQTGWGYHCVQVSDNQVTLFIFKQENALRFDALKSNALTVDKAP